MRRPNVLITGGHCGGSGAGHGLIAARGDLGCGVQAWAHLRAWGPGSGPARFGVIRAVASQPGGIWSGGLGWFRL